MTEPAPPRHLTGDEKRLDDLEAAFAQVDVPKIESVDDLARVEAERASRHFGFEPTGDEK